MTDKDLGNLRKLVEIAPRIEEIYVRGDMSTLTTKPVVAVVVDNTEVISNEEFGKCLSLFHEEYGMYENGVCDISLDFHYRTIWIPEFLCKYTLVYDKGVWFV